MTFRTASVVVCLLLAASSCGPAWGITRYHIRPRYDAGSGVLIDGLEVNGAQYGTQGFGDAARVGRTEVDLHTGELRAYVDFNVASSSFLGVISEFSDTFKVRGGAGTEFSFDFEFEGTVASDALSVAGNFYQYDVFADLAVFRPGVAEAADWYTIAATTDEELYFEEYNFKRLNPDTDINEAISETLSFATTLASNDESFHVFARIQLAVVANSPQNVNLDFENTGSLGFYAEPDVDVLSYSGVFPNTQPVPEPMLGTAILGLLATIGLGGFRLRPNRRG